jgi:hypothetical protein
MDRSVARCFAPVARPSHDGSGRARSTATRLLAIVAWVRGLSIQGYVATLDPVAGTVYYVALGIFGLMPLLVGRGESSAAPR